jgi:hypothetical protein
MARLTLMLKMGEKSSLGRKIYRFSSREDEEVTTTSKLFFFLFSFELLALVSREILLHISEEEVDSKKL